METRRKWAKQWEKPIGLLRALLSMHPHCWDGIGGRRRPLSLAAPRLYLKERWIEERRGRNETEKGWGCAADLWPTPNLQTPATTGAFVWGWISLRPPPCKIEPLEPSPSPLDSLECDKVRVQTLSGAWGSQTELGSRIAHMFMSEHASVCVLV